MRRLLQSIIHNRKLYDRPQDEWVCGRADEGCPCVFGPSRKGECRATCECLPAKKGDRWFCTRAISLGGACMPGPLPDGACGRPVLPCTPLQSLRAKRIRLTWLMATLAIGVVLLALWGSTRNDWSNPGPLSAQHTMSAQRCADCHAETVNISLTAADRVRRAQQQNQRCLKCHDLGPHGQAPHGVDVAQLRDLARRMQTTVPPPLVLQASHALASGGPTEPACATCHQEHHGLAANLQHLSDQQCQVCHQAPFSSFKSGHPEFTSYPYNRRTRLQFDHVSHWQKHFPDPRQAATAPTSCAHCHEPASDGRKMLVRDFEKACAQCHEGQIKGEGRTAAKGLAFLRLPGIDVSALEAAGAPVGEWPDFTEGAITPFMHWMLEGDEAARKALVELGSVKLTDLSGATLTQKKAAARLIWSIKGLMADLITQGQQVMMRRLNPLASAQGPTRHTGNFSADNLQAAQQVWLPNLLAEVAAFRHGEPPAPRPAKSRPAIGKIIQPAPAPNKNEAADDLLADPASVAAADQNDLLADALVPPTRVTPPGRAGPPALEYDDAEARVGEGGWYRRDETHTLYYRPTGHADEFLTAWLETSAKDPQPTGEAIYADLSSPKAPGVCMKCHTADGEGKATQINWLTSRPQPHLHPFTTFRHAPHFSLMGVQGCITCHVLNNKAEYAGTFGENRDPAIFRSNFAPMAKDTCVTCHQPALAGSSCLQCHNYHTGELQGLQSKAAEYSGSTTERK